MSNRGTYCAYRWVACLGVMLATLMGFGQRANAQTASQSNGKAQSAIEMKLTQWRVVEDAKKGEIFLEAKSVKPGDVIEYRSVASNVSKKAVQSLVVDLPLPEGLEYLPGSSKPTTPAATAATKDGVYAEQPLVLTIKDKDGKAVKENVPYYEYRSLRWSLGDLLPGKSIEVKARARVGTSQAEAAPQAAQAPPGVSASPTAGSAARN
jgi:uncharacterized repeat protein (TIGR01451 family)